MNKQSETDNPLDPFDIMNTMRDANLKTWKSIRDANLESWSKMMIDMVNSDEYSQATGQWLDTYLTLSQPFKGMIDTMMTQVLTGMNMPMRTDVSSLAERLTNIETRLDDQDAKLDDILSAIKAASDVSSLAERLTNVETRLDNQDDKLDDILSAIKTPSVSKPTAGTSAKAKGTR
jgi:polyhydroxyalkanoic acid synthase PhaR subunit